MKTKTDRVKLYGIGINDAIITTNGHGKELESVRTWKHMFHRVYGSNHPSYSDCTIHPDWHTFSNFNDFYQKNYKPGFQLDKDILVEGNRIYGPDTCCFVPPYINGCLISTSKSNKGVARGVSKVQTRPKQYNARFSIGNGKLKTKAFITEYEAIEWYNAEKRKYVKSLAVKAFLANEINSDIYIAIIRKEFK